MRLFRVLEVHERRRATATIAWCTACGARAPAHDRVPIAIRDHYTGVTSRVRTERDASTVSRWQVIAISTHD
jgi:hypothetical protein